jgi:hypothetical protein
MNAELLAWLREMMERWRSDEDPTEMDGSSTPAR